MSSVAHAKCAMPAPAPLRGLALRRMALRSDILWCARHCEIYSQHRQPDGNLRYPYAQLVAVYSERAFAAGQELAGALA